jgi:prephenate dehydrogenase
MSAIDHLLVVGVGLIGGSFALDLKRQGLVQRVTGAGRSAANLVRAHELGIIDTVAADVAIAARDADLVLLAVPVGAMPAVFAQLAEALPADALITDVGSTKCDVIAAARAGLGPRIARFVPAHPIAGAERSGAEAARVGLFVGKPLILTPLAENDAADVARIEALWRACGAEVARMDAREHDHVFAAVSHLPHLAAFALMEELAGRPQASTYFRYAGSGFRDFTRIAGSHPEMWRDIAVANRGALLDELDAYIAKLQDVRTLLQQHDGAALERLFARARAARREWIGNRNHE